VKIAFCPTHDMLGDFFTNLLQGALFAQMQVKILDLPSGTSTTFHRSVFDKQNYGAKGNNEVKSSKVKNAG